MGTQRAKLRRAKAVRSRQGMQRANARREPARGRESCEVYRWCRMRCPEDREHCPVRLAMRDGWEAPLCMDWLDGAESWAVARMMEEDEE